MISSRGHPIKEYFNCWYSSMDRAGVYEASNGGSSPSTSTIERVFMSEYTEFVEISDECFEEVKVCEYICSSKETHTGIMATVSLKIPEHMRSGTVAIGSECILTKKEILAMLDKINEYDGIEYTYSEVEDDE